MDPFTDPEKRFVLAEMIKASRIDIQLIVSFINDYGVLPDWHEMQIPFRRTVNQCQEAAKALGIESLSQPPFHHPQHVHQAGQHHSTPQQHQQHQQFREYQRTRSPSQSLSAKRKSSGDSSAHVSKRLATETPETHSTSHLRPLQPRMAANGAAFATAASSAAASSPVRDKPKKRGRPSRAEKDAIARASGTVGHSTPYAALASKPASLHEPTTPLAPETSSKATSANYNTSQAQLPSGESREEVKDHGPPDRSPSSERGAPTVSEEARSTPSNNDHPLVIPTPQQDPSESHAIPKHDLTTTSTSSNYRVSVADLLKTESKASMTT